MNNTGLIKEYAYSERDYDYEVICGSVKGTYPSYFRLDEKDTGTQKDQKDIGACVAMTISSIAEAYWNRELNETGEHSEGWTYGKFRIDSSKGAGMVVSSALQKWVEIGTIPKTFMNLLIEMPEMKEVVAKYPELEEVAKKYRLTSYIRLRDNSTSTKDEQLKDALMKYNYGLLCIDNAHCMQLVGWDDEKDKYILKDSYNNGFKTIKKDNVDQIWLPIFEPVTLPFEDVDENSWSYKAIKNLYLSGIVNGTSATTMEPKRNITREEVFFLVDKLRKENQMLIDVVNRLANEKDKLEKDGYKILTSE